MCVMNVLSFPHQITRLVFDAGQPYEKFRSRYEAAVPSAYPQRPGESAGRYARWHETTADADAPSPSGFVLYWRLHMTPTMTTAGDMRPCTAYLMGLHAIPEDIYRQDPAVLLYTPLRTLIYIDGDDRTRFAVDSPARSSPASPTRLSLNTASGLIGNSPDCPTRSASSLACCPRWATSPFSGLADTRPRL
jgi:hypothetical protein